MGDYAGLIVALFITFAVSGSVLWVMPSQREKSLTNMRSRALELGLKVRVLDEKLAKQHFHWLENYRPYTLYECSMPTDARPSSHKARVLRLSRDYDEHELDRDELKQQLSDQGVFDNLPDTVEALVISRSGLAILWKEKQESTESLAEIDSIKSCLQSCLGFSKLWV
jgi:hypothetical protein